MMNLITYLAILYHAYKGDIQPEGLYDGTEWEGFTPKMKYALIAAYRALLK